jgi:hypothetical protein
MMGRDFTPADNQQGAEKVALISYGVWQRDFAAAGNIVGTAVRINGKPATIIGVMPKGFAFRVNEEIWLPLFSEFPPRPRNDPNANIAGGARTAETRRASDQATRSSRRWRAGSPPRTGHEQAVQHRPGAAADRQLHAAGAARMLLTMLAFCVGVLLIACVNVMNMQFARATLRAKELAIPIVARRVARPADAADADRKPAGREHRRGGRDRPRLPQHWLARPHGPQPRQPAACLYLLRRQPDGAGGDGARDDRGGAVLWPAAGVDVVADRTPTLCCATAAAATPAAA